MGWDRHELRIEDFNVGETKNFKIEDNAVEYELNAYLDETGQTVDDFRTAVEEAGYPFDYYMEKMAANVLISRYLEEEIFKTAGNDIERNAQFNAWYQSLRSSADITYYDETLEALVNFRSAAGGCCP